MSARDEIEKRIYDNWADRKVAAWVIGQLGLLKYEDAHEPCPVFELSLTEGVGSAVSVTEVDRFKQSRKLVLSGGLEGTNGHLRAVDDMREIRAITCRRDIITLLLEPDFYIREKKGREPLADIEQRTKLWSTSGLVDAVIKLPTATLPDSEHYLKVHESIAPAQWVTNLENPHWREVITRPDLPYIETVRLFVQYPEIHASYLDSTKSVTEREFTDNLLENILKLTRDNQSYQIPTLVSPEYFAVLIFRKLIEKF